MDIRKALLERRQELHDEMTALAGAMHQIDWTLAKLDEPEEGAEE
jgi:hypothetical protein